MVDTTPPTISHPHLPLVGTYTYHRPVDGTETGLYNPISWPHGFDGFVLITSAGDTRFNSLPATIPGSLIELLRSGDTFGWLESRVEVITRVAGIGIQSIEYGPVPVAVKVTLLHKLNLAHVAAQA